MLLENWMNDNKYMLQIILILSLLLTVSGCGRFLGLDMEESGSSIGTELSGSITLSWDEPMTNSDGTPLTDLGGYKIYYGMSSGNYSYSVNLGNQTGATISNLSAGMWCFAVTTYDLTGNESDVSGEICTVPL